MEGTCYGNYLDFDDCSITSQSGFTLSTGCRWMGLVDWYEHLPLDGRAAGIMIMIEMNIRTMQMDTKDQNDIIVTTAMNAIQTVITSHEP